MNKTYEERGLDSALKRMVEMLQRLQQAGTK